LSSSSGELQKFSKMLIRNFKPAERAGFGKMFPSPPIPLLIFTPEKFMGMDLLSACFETSPESELSK
jgi:hypothetical protein